MSPTMRASWSHSSKLPGGHRHAIRRTICYSYRRPAGHHLPAPERLQRGLLPALGQDPLRRPMGPELNVKVLLKVYRSDGVCERFIVDTEPRTPPGTTTSASRAISSSTPSPRASAVSPPSSLPTSSTSKSAPSRPSTNTSGWTATTSTTTATNAARSARARHPQHLAHG